MSMFGNCNAPGSFLRKEFLSSLNPYGPSHVEIFNDWPNFLDFGLGNIRLEVR